ncbi:MAG TPA: hypothetical protein VLL54_08320 [Pyrinomonadaceae bacterium]|nr:hypothetical protein [Pyrinomonadaceae bacterium]
MRLALGLVLIILISAVVVCAQDSASAAQTVETLRAQLAEVQTKESELQARARQLDEDLKPENIERYFAGTGSTRPEELREQRRRQLTIERDGVSAQLKILANSQERLESVIRTAEAVAYQKSAEGNATLLGQGLLGRIPSSVWLGLAGAGFAIILAMLIAFALVRPPKKLDDFSI